MRYIEWVKSRANKEWLLGLYILAFILGMTSDSFGNFYNEYRVAEIALLLLFGLIGVFYKRYSINKVELSYLIFIAFGSLYWQYSAVIITDMLLAYLLFKSFELLSYNALVTKFIVLSSLLLFILLPIALLDYVTTGVYTAHWYPLPWNIRVYDSYFLIIAIFTVWYYLTEKRYTSIYLLILFLTLFAILLDAGRSATIAYSMFIFIIALFYPSARRQLISVYALSWIAYISISYIANLSSADLRITRESSSGRIDLWINAMQCWMEHPIIGCGFYQLDSYSHLSAHPHNIFIQILSETGLIGLGFLIYIVFLIAKRVDFHSKKNHFIIAALLAVGFDLSLSGIHIYPVNQIILVWLFVFLLKNPDFSYTHHKEPNSVIVSSPFLPLILQSILIIWFSYLFISYGSSSSETGILFPRFWIKGYHLF